ncbi:MAG: M3 family metallopeptidase [Bacteroidales bacterium]|nr:M3 family metallopeptidase [Bacteroidales bacterium]
MRKFVLTLSAALFLISCNMENPVIAPSDLPFGAPRFDQIKESDYLPAFQKAIEEGKKEIDAIASNPDAPTFENTVSAMEYACQAFSRAANIFYNLMEANTSDTMQEIAEQLAPLTNDYELYISLNEPLFERIKAVWESKDSAGLSEEQMRLLEKTYKGFVRNGANLSAEDKKTYGELSEKLSLASLKFGKNSLAAKNAYKLQLTTEEDLAGLPDFVRDAAALTAKDAGMEGWVIDLNYPSYKAFMQYSTRRDLREKLYKAYNSKALGGEWDNDGTIHEILSLRQELARLLGYSNFAAYALENRMAKTPETVDAFLDKLMKPSLPVARKEVAEIERYAKQNGFEGQKLMPWDFTFWTEKYKAARYDLSDEMLKPYFQLDSCIKAVFGLAGKLYGLQFNPRTDIPVYHPDVRVYDVTDENGKHVALFYADFFPRDSKRGGAWMTSFRDQYKTPEGEDVRPLISIVTNFTKPTADKPSLITHDELTTLLHEFGHSLHGMLSEGTYPSLSGTSVARDFVELPSQIMENWAYESEFLNTFARHYQTGETIPVELMDKIKAAQNYMAAYSQVRQLHFGILDMAWHNRDDAPAEQCEAFEQKVLSSTAVLLHIDGTAFSPTFTHIFSGGYAAGYYSYKWAEVLEADAFSLFQEKGIFSREAADAFRTNILSKGGSRDEALMYRDFRGHDPAPEALLRKLGIIR